MKLPTVGRRDAKIFAGSFMFGSIFEFGLIKSGFYDHLRLAESRKRAQDLDDLEDAIDRLSKMEGFEMATAATGDKKQELSASVEKLLQLQKYSSGLIRPDMSPLEYKQSSDQASQFTLQSISSLAYIVQSLIVDFSNQVAVKNVELDELVSEVSLIKDHLTILQLTPPISPGPLPQTQGPPGKKPKVTRFQHLHHVKPKVDLDLAKWDAIGVPLLSTYSSSTSHNKPSLAPAVGKNIPPLEFSSNSGSGRLDTSGTNGMPSGVQSLQRNTGLNRSQENLFMSMGRNEKLISLSNAKMPDVPTGPPSQPGSLGRKTGASMVLDYSAPTAPAAPMAPPAPPAAPMAPPAPPAAPMAPPAPPMAPPAPSGPPPPPGPGGFGMGAPKAPSGPLVAPPAPGIRPPSGPPPPPGGQPPAFGSMPPGRPMMPPGPPPAIPTGVPPFRPPGGMPPGPPPGGPPSSPGSAFRPPGPPPSFMQAPAGPPAPPPGPPGPPPPGPGMSMGLPLMSVPVAPPMAPPVSAPAPPQMAPPPSQPEPPAEPEAAKDYVRVLYPYSATADDELSVQPGQMLLVTGPDLGDGWMECENSVTGKKGLVPSSYVQLV